MQLSPSMVKLVTTGDGVQLIRSWIRSVHLGSNSIFYVWSTIRATRPFSTGKTEIIGVSLSQRKNVNAHIVYDASWADGYSSSYVFWSNGKAEIFSKNGVGEIERTNARFRRMSNGDCVITADTNAVTTFPLFSPVMN